MNFSCKGRHLMVECQRKDFYSYEDFLEILRLLRAPGGCPWDREQTHSSIRRNFLEETYEVLDAIDPDDASGMCEELGDVLMQVAFHAHIEAERGRFTMANVVDGVALVDREKCTGCGACAKACPNAIISIIPEHKRKPVVLCQNKDKGAQTRKACSAGCIGCMKCAKACPKQAITVENNLAYIDQEKCVGCGLCAKECPVGVIHVPAAYAQQVMSPAQEEAPAANA